MFLSSFSLGTQVIFFPSSFLSFLLPLLFLMKNWQLKDQVLINYTYLWVKNAGYDQPSLNIIVLFQVLLSSFLVTC